MSVSAATSRVQLSVVVTTSGRVDVLEPCLASVRQALERVACTNELVVSDNGSNDASGELVRAAHPDAIIVRAEDRGFTPALERGLAAASGAWILTLNDDTTVEADCFAELMAAGQVAENVGAVAAQMRFAHDPGTINSAGIEIDRLGVPYDRRLGEPIDASETEITEVFGPSAGAALYRRQMLDEVGGFDVSFYAYLEDADLAWRARMAGWRAVYAPRAVVYHEHSATLRHGSAVKYFLVGRNRVRMLAKNATRAQLLRNLGGMFAYDLGYVVYVLLTARTAAAGRGRIAGLREWRRYRRAGLAGRREVALAPVAGIRAALRRNRAWQR